MYPDDDLNEYRLVKTPDWFEAPQQKFRDLNSAVLNPSNTVVEAEAYAASIGVLARYEGHLDIGNSVNQMLSELKERIRPVKGRGALMFSHIFINTKRFDKFLTKGISPSSVVAETEENVLFINPGALFWNSPHTNTIFYTGKVSFKHHILCIYSTMKPDTFSYHIQRNQWLCHHVRKLSRLRSAIVQWATKTNLCQRCLPVSWLG